MKEEHSTPTIARTAAAKSQHIRPKKVNLLRGRAGGSAGGAGAAPAASRTASSHEEDDGKNEMHGNITMKKKKKKNDDDDVTLPIPKKGILNKTPRYSAAAAAASTEIASSDEAAVAATPAAKAKAVVAAVQSVVVERPRPTRRNRRRSSPPQPDEAAINHQPIPTAATATNSTTTSAIDSASSNTTTNNNNNKNSTTGDDDLLEAMMANNATISLRRSSTTSSLLSSPPTASTATSSSSATSIEGYTPKTVTATTTTTTAAATASITTTTNTPVTTKKDEEDNKSCDNNGLLVVNSLSELMELAGTLPKSQPNDTTASYADNVKALRQAQMIEADLQFSVASPEEYHALQQEQLEDEYKLFMGQQEPEPEDNKDDDDDDDDADENENDPARMNSEEGDNQSLDGNGVGGRGGVWDLLDEDYDDEDPIVVREPRAFLKLWTAIAAWISPQAVSLIHALLLQSSSSSAAAAAAAAAASNESNHHGDFEKIALHTAAAVIVDRSDIEASRCAGLMAILQLHMPRCLKELQEIHKQQQQQRRGQQDDDNSVSSSNTCRNQILYSSSRILERTLGDLVRSFHFAQPMPKLDTTMSRAMTCILLDTIVHVMTPLSPSSSNQQQDGRDEQIGDETKDATKRVPPCCQAVGLTWEEYRYLTRSAIINFDPDSAN